MQQAGEQVLTEGVGAEGVGQRGSLKLGLEVDLGDRRAVKERAQDKQRRQGGENGRAHEGEPVTPKSSPRLARERDGGPGPA